MTIQNIIIGAVAIGLLALVGYVSATPLRTTVVELGASAPDFATKYLKWGSGRGVRITPTAINFTGATTTPCAIQSPNATSTLISAGIMVDTSTTTAAVRYTLAKAANAFATTTTFSEGIIAASSKGTIIATTTVAQASADANALDEKQVFGPSEWFVVGAAIQGVSGDVAGFAPDGACHATFEEYPNL